MISYDICLTMRLGTSDGFLPFVSVLRCVLLNSQVLHILPDASPPALLWSSHRSGTSILIALAMALSSPLLFTQSVNFGRHLTEILYPFEISYQIFIHTLPYQYLSFRNFTLPKFSFEKSYLTKIFFSEMLRNFTIIKVSVNRLYVNVTLRKLR